MYFPYFRGKQFELLAIRESASILAESNFVPIIEPVRQSLNGLERTLNTVCESGGKAVVIVNPFHGDHREDGEDIEYLLNEGFSDTRAISRGVILDKEATVDEAISYHKNSRGRSRTTFIHAGFLDARRLAEALGEDLQRTRNVFIEAHSGVLYRRHFRGSRRILLRDGFIRRRNADHPLKEFFSDLHVTFEEEGMNGFGDFLIVGDDYNESGGPAYAVAIHLTFIDPNRDSGMYIYHFVSTTKDTPTDPAGKFKEALDKLVSKLNSGQSNLEETTAIKEFRKLHAKGHFPGLGYVKKLSMKHHIETMAAFAS